MSGNGGRPVRSATKKTDRRIVRTRDRLGDALIALIQEKPFESVTVQEVLNRAGVSRSTFYQHFEDKNDLFLSDAADFLEKLSTVLSRRGDRSKRVAPVGEFFEHVAQSRGIYSALVAANRLHDFLDLAQEYFARGIEQRFKEIPASSSIAPKQRVAMAQAHAGAMISLLTWWVQAGAKGSAADMDELFHRMVWSGIDPVAGASRRATTQIQRLQK